MCTHQRRIDGTKKAGEAPRTGFQIRSASRYAVDMRIRWLIYWLLSLGAVVALLALRMGSSVDLAAAKKGGGGPSDLPFAIVPLIPWEVPLALAILIWIAVTARAFLTFRRGSTALALVGCALTLGAATVARGEESVRFSASLIDASSKPLAGVEVSVVGHPDLRTLSGEDGRATLEIELPLAHAQRLRVLDADMPMPPQELILMLARDGFAPRITGIPATPGETVDLGTVPMTPSGTVRGRVVDPDGNPVAGAWVAAIRPLPAGPDVSLLKAFGYNAALATIAVRTDARGEYRLEGVSAGFATLVAKEESTYFGYSRPHEIEPRAMKSIDDIVVEPAGADSFLSGVV